jgi:hypothetical protein
MTEEELTAELGYAKKQLHMWWEAIGPHTPPKRIHAKILFLRGYLNAINALRDEKIVGEVVCELKEEFWKKRLFSAGFFRST